MNILFPTSCRDDDFLELLCARGNADSARRKYACQQTQDLILSIHDRYPPQMTMLLFLITMLIINILMISRNEMLQEFERLSQVCIIKDNSWPLLIVV